MIYFGRKMDVAEFAGALQARLGKDSVSTTITRVGKSADYSVSIATDMSSEDIVSELAVIYSLTRTDTLPESTRAGLYRIK